MKLSTMTTSVLHAHGRMQLMLVANFAVETFVLGNTDALFSIKDYRRAIVAGSHLSDGSVVNFLTTTKKIVTKYRAKLVEFEHDEIGVKALADFILSELQHGEYRPSLGDINAFADGKDSAAVALRKDIEDRSARAILAVAAEELAKAQRVTEAQERAKLPQAEQEQIVSSPTSTIDSVTVLPTMLVESAPVLTAEEKADFARVLTVESSPVAPTDFDASHAVLNRAPEVEQDAVSGIVKRAAMLDDADLARLVAELSSMMMDRALVVAAPAKGKAKANGKKKSLADIAELLTA